MTSLTSLSSIVSGAHSAIADRSVTTKASDELQALFAKLHTDALSATSASTAATGTAATASGSATTTASASGAVTGIASGLRSIFDGAVSVASTARSAAKLAASYGSGVGMAGLAMQAFDKLA